MVAIVYKKVTFFVSKNAIFLSIKISQVYTIIKSFLNLHLQLLKDKINQCYSKKNSVAFREAMEMKRQQEK
jgi:hypothetical protein